MKPSKRQVQPRFYLYNLKIIDSSFLDWVKPDITRHEDFRSYFVFKTGFLFVGLALLLNSAIGLFWPVVAYPNKTIELTFIFIGFFCLLFGVAIKLPPNGNKMPSWKGSLLEAKEIYNRAVKIWNEHFPMMWTEAMVDRTIAEFNRRYWQLSHFSRVLFEMEERAKANLITPDDLSKLYLERVEIEMYFLRL